MIKAVIFDMDGTMVNTEELWREVNLVIANNHNVNFDHIIQKQMLGRKENEALELFKEYYNLNTTVSELQKERKQILFANINKISLNKGLIELLNLLEKLNIRKAVATSAFIDFTNAVLNQFNIENKFDVIVTGDQVDKGKPNPEIFLKSASLLKLSPNECLVIEDAQNGVEAGYNAGMKTIAIPHDNSKDHDFTKATKIVASMFEINEDMIKNL